jgi:xanthine dehydrogenase YagS FAD-binding subunit
MLPRFAYIRPRNKNEALDQLAESGAYAHAGGTDLIGCLRDEVFHADTVVSLSGLSELSGITERADGGLDIGALTTISQVAKSDLVRELYPGLAQAAGDVASPQLRNQGTLGGNLCQRPRCWYFRGEFNCIKKGGDLCYAVEGENRYHAIFGGGPCHIVHPSDTAPMLMALGASVRIAGPQGERDVSLGDFFVLPDEAFDRENVLAAGELVTAVRLPAPAAGLRSSYRKVRERGAWDFALTSVALALTMAGEEVGTASIVLGGVAPVPWRSEKAAAAIVGKKLDETTIAAACLAAVEGAEPLAQNGYKVQLIKGALEESLKAIA